MPDKPLGPVCHCTPSPWRCQPHVGAVFQGCAPSSNPDTMQRVLAFPTPKSWRRLIIFFIFFFPSMTLQSFSWSVFLKALEKGAGLRGIKMNIYISLGFLDIDHIFSEWELLYSDIYGISIMCLTSYRVAIPLEKACVSGKHFLPLNFLIDSVCLMLGRTHWILHVVSHWGASRGTK